MPEISLREHLSRAGKAKTAAKKQASLENLEKANAALTKAERSRRISEGMKKKHAERKSLKKSDLPTK